MIPSAYFITPHHHDNNSSLVHGIHDSASLLSRTDVRYKPAPLHPKHNSHPSKRCRFQSSVVGLKLLQQLRLHLGKDRRDWRRFIWLITERRTSGPTGKTVSTIQRGVWCGVVSPTSSPDISSSHTYFTAGRPLRSGRTRWLAFLRRPLRYLLFS